MQQEKLVIHTLGPQGTNCELAATTWFKELNIEGKVVLHPTLEIAAQEIKDSKHDLLLGCAVYPDLHKLVFENLINFKLVDSFIMPTIDMVFASRGQDQLETYATHPAPASLVKDLSPVYANSNAAAASACASGQADACITTLSAMQSHGLTMIKNFGPVPMCFTVHSSHQFTLPKQNS